MSAPSHPPSALPLLGKHLLLQVLGHSRNQPMFGPNGPDSAAAGPNCFSRGLRHEQRRQNYVGRVSEGRAAQSQSLNNNKELAPKETGSILRSLFEVPKCGVKVCQNSLTFMTGEWQRKGTESGLRGRCELADAGFVVGTRTSLV